MLIWVYYLIAESELAQANFVEEQTTLQRSVQDLQEKQTEILERQTSILEAEYRPKLVEYEYAYSLRESDQEYPEAEFEYSGVISNEGEGLAQEIYFTFDIYIDEELDDTVEGYQLVDNSEGSDETVRSISELIFTKPDGAAPRQLWRDHVDFSVPFRVDCQSDYLSWNIAEETTLDVARLNNASLIKPDDPPFHDHISFNIEIRMMKNI